MPVWLSVVNRRFTAMEIVSAILLVALILTAVIATIRGMVTDGHHRVPTRVR